MQNMSFETFMSGTWPDAEVGVLVRTQEEMHADPSDWVSVLQRVAMQIDDIQTDMSSVKKPFEAHMERRVVEISKEFYQAQPFKLVSDRMIQSQVRAPLTKLLKAISDLYDLLWLDKDHINPDVAPSEVQKALLSVHNEMVRVFEENQFGFKQAYHLTVPYWQNRVKTPELKNLIALLLQYGQDHYGQILPIFNFLLEREQAFLNQRLALKAHCQGQLPPEVYQTFLDWIFPILQQRSMHCIEPLKDRVVAFINTQSRTSDCVAVVNILLKKINNSNDMAKFESTLSRLCELPEPQRWMDSFIVLQRAYNKGFTFEWILAILDQLAVNKDKFNRIHECITQASCLSLEQLYEKLTFLSIEDRQDALALSNGMVQGQQPLQAEIETLSNALSTMLDRRLVAVSECHTLGRDYLYVKALIHAHPVYYADNVQGTQHLLLSTASVEELKRVLNKILDIDASPILSKQERWRTTLQMVALLHALYTQTTQCELSDKQLLVLLTMLKKPHGQSQVLFDISADDQVISLELLTAIYCLRSGIVYLEKAEEGLLLDNNSRLDAFFGALSLAIHKHPIGAETFVKIAHQPRARVMSSHYLDTHAIQRHQLSSIARTNDVNAYSARAWIDMKEVVLRHFDALCQVMSQDNHQVAPQLLPHRDRLLNTLHLVWQGFMRELNAKTVVACDAAFVQFQQKNLMTIWKNSLEQLPLCSDASGLSKDSKQRLASLYECSADLQEDLRQCLYRPDTLQESTGTTKYQTFVKNDVAGAILWYDHARITDKNKQTLAEQHFERQLSQLGSMCPQEPGAPVMSYPDLKALIEYLDKTIQTTELTSERLAVVIYSIRLYQSVAFEHDESIEKVAGLIRAANQYCAKAIARDVMKRFQWVTDKTTYYYQWFECQAVKEAAETAYALAQEVTALPDNQDTLKAFYRALYYHKTLLSQTWYYNWGWFFWDSDPCRVLNQALNEFQDLISIGIVSKTMKQEAKETALSAFYLIPFEKRLQSIRVSETKKTEWGTVLTDIQALKDQYRGFGLLIELKQYLQTQQDKFMSHKQSFFFNSGTQQDLVSGLLVQVEQALSNIPRRSVLNDRLYLSQKERVLQASLGPTIQRVSIRPGCVGNEDYFDVSIASKEGLPGCFHDFQSVSIESDVHPNSAELVWVKRFYSSEELFALTVQSSQTLGPIHQRC